MSKKTVKVLTAILLILMIISSVAFSSLAFSPEDVKESSAVSTDSLTKVGNSVFTVIRTIGILISVIMLVVLGIKYMMGSAEEKAEYKKTMIPYLVGAVLIFTASMVSQAIYNMVKDFTI